MEKDTILPMSDQLWTMKKAVTTLAIAPQTDSLTRSGRMAYNVLIFKAQQSSPDAEGGYTAPLSEIVKRFGSTTRESHRIRSYIEQMCTTVVRWFPLSPSDDPQSTLDGLEPVLADPDGEGRIFTLLAEARISKRSGEQWVTWFFPPSINDMLVNPARWARLNIKELASLSHYASVALYEICARYRDVPGGLTNRAHPDWWVQALKGDPDTKPREWRKFKSETLKPAIAEICQRTSLDIRLVEYRQGRAVTAVQFALKRKAVSGDISPVDVTLVDQAESLGVRERDLDLFVDEYGEIAVGAALALLEGRLRSQPSAPIPNRSGYLRKILKNGVSGSLFERPLPDESPSPSPLVHLHTKNQEVDPILAQRLSELSQELSNLTPEKLEEYAAIAEAALSNSLMDASLRKRFIKKQYHSPLIWSRIRDVYAEEKYGPGWRTQSPRQTELPTSL